MRRAVTPEDTGTRTESHTGPPKHAKQKMAKKMGGSFAAHCIWLLAQDYSLKIVQKQCLLDVEWTSLALKSAFQNPLDHALRDEPQHPEAEYEEQYKGAEFSSLGLSRQVEDNE